MKLHDENKHTKIYSRPRFNVEDILIGNYDWKKTPKKHNIKFSKLAVIIVIAIITAVCIIRAIDPIIDKLCIDEAKNVATKIANLQATEVMKNYSYEDFITIVRDEGQNVVMLQANINTINAISSAIPVKIVEEFEKENNRNISIYLGSLMGLKIFSGAGPKISAKIANTGNVETTLKSEFIHQGVNQTLHRIYLEMSIDVSILTPYDVAETNIVNQVLIAESVIIGDVPSAYYNLDTSNSSEAMRIID